MVHYSGHTLIGNAALLEGGLFVLHTYSCISPYVTCGVFYCVCCAREAGANPYPGHKLAGHKIIDKTLFQIIYIPPTKIRPIIFSAHTPTNLFTRVFVISWHYRTLSQASQIII